MAIIRTISAARTARPFKATPHKARLTALHAICLLIFRHTAQKSLDIRQYACGIFVQSVEKSDYASYAQALCGVALKMRLHKTHYTFVKTGFKPF